MEGPTPVSSLIHAATLVTLGFIVFVKCIGFISRFCYLVFIMYVLSGLSVITSGLGFDIKRSIAYTTVVQLMFSLVLVLSCQFCGLYVYLVVHALYKSFGFMIFGNIQHVHSIQDVRYCRNTHIIVFQSFLVVCLALFFELWCYGYCVLFR